MSFSESATAGQGSTKEPRPSTSAQSLSDQDVVAILLRFFARKQFPVYEDQLLVILDSNKALVLSACQVVLDGGGYQGDVVKLHQTIVEAG